MAKKEERKVMYICDNHRDCASKFSCSLCRYTSDPDHALYPVHNNFLRDEHDKNLWWEVEE